MMQKSRKKLLEPASAIENYFENLLADEEPADTQPVAIKSNLRVFTDLEIELSRIDQMAIDEREAVNPAVDINEQEFNEINDFGAVSYIDRVEFPLQCLMFHVGGSQLSIPLVDLLSVVPKIENLTRLPHVPEWFIGLIHHRDSKIKVVDTASLLCIDAGEKNSDSQHVLVLKDADWGITCDRPGEIIRLNEDDVKWSKSGNNGLVLGTIKQSLAALVDPDKIINRVSTGYQPND